MHCQFTHGHQSGFSLLQLSVILTVGALILASTLPGGVEGGDIGKQRITLARMERIEEAMQDFMVENARRPYPADLTALPTATEFGVEISVPTDYSSAPTTHFTSAAASTTFTRTDGSNALASGDTSGLRRGFLLSGTGIPTGTWAEAITSASALSMNHPASASGTSAISYRNPLVAGSVPTKALALPDEYAFDGYGRRIIYMVDARTTSATGCEALQRGGLRGLLALSSSDDFATGTFDHVMSALLSPGKDGQGGVSMQGVGLDGRIKNGNTDAATLVNAFYDGTQTTSFTNLGLVKKSPTTDFDDIVWVNEARKNTCAMGRKSQSKRDFRIDGGAGGNGTSAVAIGDINGDGYQDMVIGVAASDLVRVVYGKKGNWPEPSTALSTSGLAGTDGFAITKGTESVSGFGSVVATADVNGDGYDDVIASGTPTTTADTAVAVVFGRASFTASVSISTLSGSTGFLIENLNNSVASHLATGDVNGDGLADITLPFDASGASDWAQGVIYGKASGWSNITLNTTFLDGTNGVYFNVTTPNGSNGDVSYGSSGASTLDRRLAAVCNLNGDGFWDLIMPGVLSGSATITPQRFYVMLGAASWSHSSGLIDPSSDGRMLYFVTSAAGASPTYDVKSLACGDITGDGPDDLLMYLKNNSTSQEYVFAYAGRSSWSAVDIDTSYDIRFDLTASAPSWQDSASIPRMLVADVNHDGRKDLLFSRSADDPYTNLSGSTFTIPSTATGTQRSNAGTVSVLYQPSSWGSMPGLNKGVFSDYTYDGTGGVKFAGAVASDALSVQAAADLNKDGKMDLLAGSGVSPMGGYVFFGKTSPTSAYDTNCTRSTSDANCTAQITNP